MVLFIGDGYGIMIRYMSILVDLLFVEILELACEQTVSRIHNVIDGNSRARRTKSLIRPSITMICI